MIRIRSIRSEERPYTSNYRIVVEAFFTYEGFNTPCRFIFTEFGLEDFTPLHNLEQYYGERYKSVVRTARNEVYTTLWSYTKNREIKFPELLEDGRFTSHYFGEVHFNGLDMRLTVSLNIIYDFENDSVKCNNSETFLSEEEVNTIKRKAKAFRLKEIFQ